MNAFKQSLFDNNNWPRKLSDVYGINMVNNNSNIRLITLFAIIIISVHCICIWFGVL